MLIAGLAGAGAYQANPKFTQRIDQSMAALDLSYEGLNTASSMRMHLWRNALKVMENHPINGAGVRSYRYAYAQYAEAGDPYVNPDGTGMAYAHQLLLEVGSETGMIGVIGLVAFFAVFVRARPRFNVQDSLGWVAWLGAFALLFPVNSHTAIYSAFWSLLIGWVLAVGMSRQVG